MPARARRRVQLRGGARWQPARRTFCTLSRLPRAPTKQMALIVALAAVEDLVAELFEPERRVVCAPLGLLAYSCVYDLADENRVIALLDRADEAALDVGGGVREDGRARAARAEGLAGERRPLPLGGLEECEGHRLLALAEHVEREGLRLL